jgi:hypothetical protein
MNILSIRFIKGIKGRRGVLRLIGSMVIHWRRKHCAIYILMKIMAILYVYDGHP